MTNTVLILPEHHGCFEVNLPNIPRIGETVNWADCDYAVKNVVYSVSQGNLDRIPIYLESFELELTTQTLNTCSSAAPTDELPES
jgi:hypothetical protein